MLPTQILTFFADPKKVGQSNSSLSFSPGQVLAQKRQSLFDTFSNISATAAFPFPFLHIYFTIHF